MNNLISKRSSLFTVLGIISLIANGFATLFNGITLLILDKVQTFLQSDDFNEQVEQFFSSGIFEAQDMDSINAVLAATPIISTIRFVAAVGSFAGVYMLFKGKSQGFIWYLTAQMLELVLPTLLVDKLNISLFSVIITVIFFAVYYRESKRLSDNERFNI